jgi:hemerythrin
MPRLQWTSSHAVFVAEMDDEHREIFDALAALRTALAGHMAAPEIRRLTGVLTTRIQEHFAHEERLMRAARYCSYRWHKQRHEGAVRKVAQFAKRLGRGDTAAGPELIDFLSNWLNDHTRVADMMLGAFLRNHQRGLYRMSFRAGTKGPDEVAWLDTRGETFVPHKTR